MPILNFLLDTKKKILYIICVEVCGKNFSSQLITQIKTTIAAQPDISRQKLARQVCQWTDWRSPNGTLKEMSCRVALLNLHRQGLIELPEAKSHPNLMKTSAASDVESFPEPSPIECLLAELGPVSLVRIKPGDKAQSRRWNAMMQKYHYLGSGPLCGAQIRYFIESEQFGMLGGLAFSAAAWRVSVRDDWIGWDDITRQKRLNQIVNNSRFLIVPQVKVKNLASHVLALAIEQLPIDWQTQYAIQPLLLETFVEKDRFQGTCYRAANWIHVGQTKGRGRQDSNNTKSVPIKDVYVYPLHENVPAMLNGGSSQGQAVEPRVAVDWADEEFGTSQLGDQRRDNRLLTIARDFYARPQASVPQACQSRAKTKAAYRFFEDDNHTMETILKPHYESTRERVKQEKVVLAVQDSTSLNYATHPATEGLGSLSTNQQAIGLLLHDTMAFNTDQTPLGLLDVQCWARDPEEYGKKHYSHKLPIEQKESYKWLKSYQAVAAVQKQCPDTMLVSVGDREADIYELFDLALTEPNGPKVLVRARHDRLLAEGQDHLWDYVQVQPISGIQQVQVPRQGRRKARVAQLEIRFAKVTLKPPGKKRGLKPLTIWVVLAQEINCPEDVKEPLEWLLLTSIEVASFEQAIQMLAWYACRWGIEVYHRTLKSGCKIEQRQLRHADRIEPCLSIDMVVAWRIFHLTKLGREVPDVPCTVFFEEAEWKALATYKTQSPIPPEQPPSLREAIHMVASLGGFLGRKSDGEPGTKTMWMGLQRLEDLTVMWKIMTSDSISKNKASPRVQNPRYG